MAFGLNSRKKASNPSKSNVFGDDGDSSDDESDEGNQGKSRREVVNKQIAREQAAHRRRAQADLASSTERNVYDYDGAYDSFQQKQKDTTKKEVDQEKKSKYIEDLLKAAKVRERERDVIYERRNAKEQEEEDAKADYRGKEKFVTNSYKRKLQERKQWEVEQKQKEREEEANDVTKKSAGSAFAGFYGNLNRSAMTEQTNENLPSAAADRDKENGEKRKNSAGPPGDDDFDPRQGFLGGFERSSNGNAGGGGIVSSEPVEDESADKVTKLSIRELREKKVAEARERYLKRKESNRLEQ